MGKVVLLEDFTSIGRRKYVFYGCSCGEIGIAREDVIRSGVQQTCRDCMYKKKEKGPLEHLYKSYVRSAKEEGRAWNLSRKQFLDLIQKDCHYCGHPPTRRHQPRKDREVYAIVNGIDRVNNRYGYSKVNCVTCCQICNRAKHAGSLDDFEFWKSHLIINFLYKGE